MEIISKNIHIVYIIKNSIIILIILLYYIFKYSIKIKINQLINSNNLNNTNTDELIKNLNKYSIYREPKYILLFDYIYSHVCEDLNAYTIFNYYQQNNIKDVYYVINEGNELYKSLLNLNKTENIIPYKDDKSMNNNPVLLFRYFSNNSEPCQIFKIFIYLPCSKLL